IAGPLCPSDTADHGNSRRCRLGHVISCVQSQLLTWDIYTDHQGTDDQCGPRSATCQCSSVPHQCHIPVHINATYQCPSELPFNVTHQCHLSMPISATYQCCQSSVPRISAVFQCPSVMP
ncbi:unnamed protein product, partial [Staurois parvus]